MNEPPPKPTANPTTPLCWFCETAASQKCDCGRPFCRAHGLDNACVLCATVQGHYGQAGTAEPLTDLLVLSLAAASGDTYLVVPSRLRGVKPLPISGVERTLRALMRRIKGGTAEVQGRAAAVLAGTTVTWATMDPSQLSQHIHGTGLLAFDQVREWLLYSLKQFRTVATEQQAIGVLDRLRMTDFRDPYPSIAQGLPGMKQSNAGTRVHEMFSGLDGVYPTSSYAINERIELFVYDQYINRRTGAGALMERMYGEKLRYAPVLAKMLKKGVWHSSFERFNAWYPGEDEPY